MKQSDLVPDGLCLYCDGRPVALFFRRILCSKTSTQVTVLVGLVTGSQVQFVCVKNRVIKKGVTADPRSRHIKKGAPLPSSFGSDLSNKSINVVRRLKDKEYKVQRLQEIR